MLSPKRQKYRKTFRGKNRGLSLRGATLNFGEYGLKALTASYVSAAQIEAARKAVTHWTKREGKLWLRIFPSKPITAKAEGRMGAGKGEVKSYAAAVTPGKILFELSGVVEKIAREAFERAAAKLPLKTKFILRSER